MINTVHRTANHSLKAKNKDFIFMSRLVTIANRWFTPTTFGYDSLSLADYFQINNIAHLYSPIICLYSKQKLKYKQHDLTLVNNKSAFRYDVIRLVSRAE